MDNALIAAVVGNHPGNEAATRITRLLDFFGISWQVFEDLSALRRASLAGILRDRRYSIIGSITKLADLFEGQDEDVRILRHTAQSLFCYVDEDITRSAQLLQVLTKSPTATLVLPEDAPIEIEVSKCCPAITGPMDGIRATTKPGPKDYALATDRSLPISEIIGARNASFFFEIDYHGLRTFVNCSAGIPNVDGPLNGRYYDIKNDFLSAVPIVLYLKWAFRDSCWHTSELGACLIIDDPILKTKYGFCDFRQIDAQMRELGFSTNISVIPWNWRRTSETTAALVRESGGRFSVSIHGCDHTGGEFATHAIPALNQKVTLAKQRMENHRERSGVAHDSIMVFPQGAFSRESLAVLQQHQFLAVVNTEVFPVNGADPMLTVADVWSVAMEKYGSFPVFTRRYPNHGLENFAFDLLLGKPCLIVEHHQFFKGGGGEAGKFICALRSLNCRLQWRSLGEVLKRAYQSRIRSTGEIEIRMFANELLLHNESSEERSYKIEKMDKGSAGIEQVSVNGAPVQWKTDNASITFTCTLSAKAEAVIQIQYQSSLDPVVEGESLKTTTKTALRRYLSEFRDTFLSQHNFLASVAQTAKSCLTKH